MLNSLYGRFGLKPITSKSSFVKVKDIPDLESSRNM
jgi:hypothetical protein